MKAVKIISILTAIITVVLVILPVGGTGLEPVKNTAKMAVPQDDIKAAATGLPLRLSTQVEAAGNILERFNKSKLAGPAADKDQVPPLVKEAKAFALYLNPPPPPERKPAANQSAAGGPGLPVSEIGPRGSSNQFKLIATCVNQSNPQLSLALIDLPGEGFKWVRQSSKVGHLVIKEIKDSLLVVQDSQRAFNVLIEPRPQQISLVKGKSFVSQRPMQTPTASELFAPFTPVETTQISGQDESVITQTPQQNTTPAVSEPKPLTAEEEAFAQKFMNEIDSIIVNSGTDEAALDESMKKVDELKKKYFSGTGEVKTDGQQTPKKDDSSKKIDKPTPNTNDPNLTRRQPPRRRPSLTRSPVR